MLSKKKATEYKQSLRDTNTYCTLIRLGVKNLETKIKQTDFQNQYNLIGIQTALFTEELNERVNNSTFLMLISDFERIMYLACISEGKRLKEDVQAKFLSEKFLDVFVSYKTKNDIYPFSFVKNIYSKISTIDLNYISELIDIRNFIAHGKKEPNDLQKADINIINDLTTITTKLCDLIDKIEV